MENGWMDWIEWMWKVESGAVPDLTLRTKLAAIRAHFFIQTKGTSLIFCHHLNTRIKTEKNYQSEIGVTW